MHIVILNHGVIRSITIWKRLPLTVRSIFPYCFQTFWSLLGWCKRTRDLAERFLQCTPTSIISSAMTTSQIMEHNHEGSIVRDQGGQHRHSSYSNAPLRGYLDSLHLLDTERLNMMTTLRPLPEYCLHEYKLKCLKQHNGFITGLRTVLLCFEHRSTLIRLRNARKSLLELLRLDLWPAQIFYLSATYFYWKGTNNSFVLLREGIHSRLRRGAVKLLPL